MLKAKDNKSLKTWLRIISIILLWLLSKNISENYENYLKTFNTKSQIKKSTYITITYLIKFTTLTICSVIIIKFLYLNSIKISVKSYIKNIINLKNKKTILIQSIKTYTKLIIYLITFTLIMSLFLKKNNKLSTNTKNLIKKENTTIKPIFIFLEISIISPILEELIFRSAIQNILKQIYPPLTSITISSLLFSLVHFNPSHSIILIIFSITIGLSYHKYKIILIPIICHSMWNTTAYIINLYKH